MNQCAKKKMEEAGISSGDQLIEDLINDARREGLHDAVKTLEEFREMLKTERTEK